MRLTAWYAACVRSVLAIYLLVMVLGLPVVQLLHQGAHHHEGAPVTNSQMGTVASSTQASEVDESTCQLCHWLKTRVQAALIAHGSFVVQSADLESDFHSPTPQGHTRAPPNQYLARGPPRVS